MVTSKSNKKVMSDPLELTIPPPILDRSRALKTSNAGDVSRSYNITLKSPRNENLFIDNEEDLRDLLQEYLNYRKRHKEVEEKIRKQKANKSNDTDQLENTNENKKKKVTKRTTKITRIEYYRTPDDESNVDDTNQTSTAINEGSCCSHDCKGVSEKKKGSCCVIL